MEVVGIIPAAGRGTRLGTASARSKEVLEVGGKPAAGHLLDRFATAGIRNAVVVLRVGKTDIPPALLCYDDVDITYTFVDDSPSELHSVVTGASVRDSSVVALGYPDIIFEPVTAFSVLAERLAATRADLVLGLFPTDIPERVDMVVLDDESRPVDVIIKEPDRGLRYSWAIAMWTPVFTRYLIDYVARAEPEYPGELSVGMAVREAIGEGLVVEAVAFEKGWYFDIGTPEDLTRARELLSG